MSAALVRRQRQWLGRRIREANVHLNRLVQFSNSPRIAFSVDDGDNGQSSGLRGYELARELRKFGWRAVVLPKQLDLSQRQRFLRLERPDIFILQKSRHPLNRPKFYKGYTCVFDIDDADFLNPNASEGVIECMTDSAKVIAGNRFISNYARQYNANVDILWTGSRPRPPSATKKLEPVVVAWAVSSAAGYPAELALVQSCLTQVKSRNWQFWLFGADQGQKCKLLIDALEKKGILCRSFPFMDYEQFLTHLESVSIGLAPLVPSESSFSAGKSFGKVLGYLNCDVAIIASDTADHPIFFQNDENGILASNGDQFAEGIDRLLSNPTLRNQLAQKGHSDYVEKLSIQAIAKQMDAILRPLVKKNPA